MATLDPNMLAALLQTAGQQKSQLVDQILTPRSKISQNPKNGGTRAHGLAGWYELNPQARPGEGYAQEQVRVKNENFRAGLPNGGQPPQASATPAAAAATPSAKEQQSGFWSFMEKALKLGSKHEQKSNEPRINKLTGLPFGTQPGDPAYQDQLVKGAPKAQEVMSLQAEQAFNGQARDPAIQNLLDLSAQMNSFKAANPGTGVRPQGPPGPLAAMGPPRPGVQQGPPAPAPRMGPPAMGKFTPGRTPNPLMSSAPWADIPQQQSYAPIQHPGNPNQFVAEDWQPAATNIPPAFLPILASLIQPARPNFSPKVGGGFIPQYSSVPRTQY